MTTISELVAGATRLQKAAAALVKNTSNRNQNQWIELRDAQAEVAILLANFPVPVVVDDPLPEWADGPEPVYGFTEYPREPVPRGTPIDLVPTPNSLRAIL